jgi:hypothetical protein
LELAPPQHRIKGSGAAPAMVEGKSMHWKSVLLKGGSVLHVECALSAGFSKSKKNVHPRYFQSRTPGHDGLTCIDYRHSGISRRENPYRLSLHCLESTLDAEQTTAWIRPLSAPLQPRCGDQELPTPAKIPAKRREVPHHHRASHFDDAAVYILHL